MLRSFFVCLFLGLLLILSSSGFAGSYLSSGAVNSSSGAGQDVVCMVRESDDWKIAQLLTRKVGSVMPMETAAPASGCCPTGSSCN